MELAELQESRQYVATAAGRASFVDTGGDGVPVLFVHGIATNAALWRRPVGALRDERRCVALELPLHGGSPAPAHHDVSLAAMARYVAAFCEALQLVNVDLVANDTGGAIGQVFAARHPGRLRSLVLTNCDTAGNMPPKAFMSTVRLARSGLLAPALRTLRVNMRLARRQVFSSGYEDVDNLPLDVAADFLDPIIGSRAAAGLFQRWVAELSDAELRGLAADLQRLAVPTLMVWGTGDPFFGKRWAYQLHDQIAGSRGVVEVAGGRLFFPDERPDELVSALTRFWASLDPPGTEPASRPQRRHR